MAAKLNIPSTHLNLPQDADLHQVWHKILAELVSQQLDKKADETAQALSKIINPGKDSSAEKMQNGSPAPSNSKPETSETPEQQAKDGLALAAALYARAQQYKASAQSSGIAELVGETINSLKGANKESNKNLKALEKLKKSLEELQTGELVNYNELIKNARIIITQTLRQEGENWLNKQEQGLTKFDSGPWEGRFLEQVAGKLAELSRLKGASPQ